MMTNDTINQTDTTMHVYVFMKKQTASFVPFTPSPTPTVAE
jgi:hypothetical protein